MAGVEKAMEKNGSLGLLEKKGTHAEEIVEQVLANPGLIDILLTSISSSKPEVRFGSAKVLWLISEKNPKMLSSNVSFFVGLLDCSNNILKWNAIRTLANLTTVDSSVDLGEILKKFRILLYEGSLITAANIIESLSKMAQAKPEIRTEITAELLKADEIPVPTEECRNILIGKAIVAFERYFDQIKNKGEVLSFVRKQVNNPRKATRTRAEKFLGEHEEHL